MILRSGLAMAAFVGQLTLIMVCSLVAFMVDLHGHVHEAMRYSVCTGLLICPLFPLMDVLDRHLIL